MKEEIKNEEISLFFGSPMKVVYLIILIILHISHISWLECQSVNLNFIRFYSLTDKGCRIEAVISWMSYVLTGGTPVLKIILYSGNFREFRDFDLFSRKFLPGKKLNCDFLNSRKFLPAKVITISFVIYFKAIKFNEFSSRPKKNLESNTKPSNIAIEDLSDNTERLKDFLMKIRPREYLSPKVFEMKCFEAVVLKYNLSTGV